MNPDAAGTEPDDRRDLGGDPACWAHLLDEVDASETDEVAELANPAIAPFPRNFSS